MRKLLLTVMLLMSTLVGSAQSYDERIAGAMNSGDWFALDSIYAAAPKDSLNPFLDVFSRCLIGNRLNRPDVSVPAFDLLFKEYSSSLDLGNLLSSTIMYSIDLSRMGYNSQAADLTTSILEATREHLDSTWTESLEQAVSKYTALSAYKPYGVTFAEALGRVPFRIVPVGDEKHGSVLMHLENSTINGIDADITFDTGAGVNLISDSLVRKFNLIPIDGYVTAAGIGRRKGQYAIAREVRLGNMTISDVPFVIMDFKTGNAKADQHVHHFSIILGSDLMLQLKDLTVDFINREITVPPVAPDRSDAAPNMSFSDGMNLSVAGRVLDKPILMNIDTGDASYGSLGVSFFNANKEFIMANGEADTIRGGGLGGVVELLCYRMREMPVEMGGHTVGIPGLVVNTEPTSVSALSFDCNIGLKTLMMFGKVRFNLVDFVLTTYPQDITAFNSRNYGVYPVRQSLKLSKDKGASILQALGIIAVGVTRGLS